MIGDDGQHGVIAAPSDQTSGAEWICDDLVLNGYSDWFLPSRDEFYAMIWQKDLVGGFSPGLYWSSSDADGTQAFVVDFVLNEYSTAFSIFRNVSGVSGYSERGCSILMG